MSRLCELFFKGNDGKRGSFFTAVSNAGWLTGTRLASDGASLLLFIILSRYFGPYGVGQYVFGFAVAGLVYVAVNLGLEDYGVRECSRLPRNTRHVLIGKFISTQLGLTCVTLIGLLFFLVITKPAPDTTAIILIICSYQLALAFAQTLFIPAFAQESMAGPAVAELACRGGSAVVAVLLVTYFQTSLVTALITYAVGGIVLVVSGLVSALRHVQEVRIRIAWPEAVGIIEAAWPFAAAHIVYRIYTRVPLLIIGLMLGEEATGIYGAGLKFLEAGIMPFVLLGFATYPVLSRSFEEKDKSCFLEAAEKLLRGALALGGLLAWFLFFFLPSILAPLLGEEFNATATLIKPMASLAVLTAIEVSAVRVLLAMNLQVERIKVQFWGTIVIIGVTAGLIPLFGITGAIIATITASSFMNGMYCISLHRRNVAAILVRTIGQFLIILTAVFSAGVLLNWLSPHAWLATSISLAMLVVIVLWSGFVPIGRDIVPPVKARGEPSLGSMSEG